MLAGQDVEVGHGCDLSGQFDCLCVVWRILWRACWIEQVERQKIPVSGCMLLKYGRGRVESCGSYKSDVSFN